MFVWNCQGLGNPRTIRGLTWMVRQYKPHVIGLMETKSGKVKLDDIRFRLGFKNRFVVDRIEISGGLALWWKEDIDIQILNYSNHHIDAQLASSLSSRITLFYGSPYSQLRQNSWDLLRRLASMSTLP